MKRRYKIRTHECGDQDGATGAGTLVCRLGGSNTIEARTIEEAEESIREQVKAEKLLRGRVYQICPPIESSESLRALAAALDGSFERCLLDPAQGFYAEFFKIRFPTLSPGANIEELLSA